MMMKIYTSIALSVLCLAVSSLSAQVKVDPSVALSAQAAVQKMGLEMMKGNLDYGYERIYPRWKRRLAVRAGGMEKLEAQQVVASEQKKQLKLTVVSLSAVMPTSFFDVWRAKKIDAKTGLVVNDSKGNPVITENWLAIVPTVTRVKVPDPTRGGMMRVLEETGYTAVVSEKGTNEWYFMTGMKPTALELRSLFPSLPADATALGLPVSSMREIK